MKVFSSFFLRLLKVFPTARAFIYLFIYLFSFKNESLMNYVTHGKMNTLFRFL